MRLPLHCAVIKKPHKRNGSTSTLKLGFVPLVMAKYKKSKGKGKIIQPKEPKLNHTKALSAL
jgi:hypothetical protein